MTSLHHTNNFQKLILLTIAVVYLLILAGGIVRSTGSGMGCPDWPRCFGSWVPPTEVSQLPSNYQEIYGAKLKGEVEFDALKTWIEYINRLLGVITGLLIFATLIGSISYLKTDKKVFYLSALAFVLVGLEGLLGSKVVSAELHPRIVTLHLLLAVAVVFTLMYVMTRTFATKVEVGEIVKKSVLLKVLNTLIVVSLLQVLFGTQVREAMDEIAARMGESNRNQWIGNMDYRFYIHRSFSILVLLLHIGVVYVLNQNIVGKSILHNLTKILMAIIVIEVLTGIVLSYLNVPAAVQPIHVTLAVVSLGLQFVIWLGVRKAKEVVPLSA
jgi:cytochrome c oxidase assembly protein subunit 15